MTGNRTFVSDIILGNFKFLRRIYMYSKKTNKIINISFIIFLIVLLVALIILTYSILRGLNRQPEVFATMENSNKTWVCEEINMTLYPQKTDEFKKIEQQYDLSNKPIYLMLGYLKYNDKTYTIVLLPQVSDGFYIVRADNFNDVFEGSCDLTFLGFGNNIKMTSLKFDNEFRDINAKKLILKPTPY